MSATIAVSPLIFVHGFGGAPGLLVVSPGTRLILLAFVREGEGAPCALGRAPASFCAQGRCVCVCVLENKIKLEKKTLSNLRV